MNKQEVQKIERRSIALHDTPQSLPVDIDRKSMQHDEATKKYLKKHRSKFVSINK